jgi:hypothetical protein
LIVNKQWILDCYKQNQLLSEKTYQLKGSNDNGMKKDTPKRTSERKQTKIKNFDDSDEEEENEKPLISKDVTRKTPIKKKITTFDDDDDEEEPEPPRSVKQKAQTKKKTTTFDDNGNTDPTNMPLRVNLISFPFSL